MTNTIWDILRDIEPALVTMAWRGGIWILLVVLLLASLPKISAAIRHWIAFCGLLGLLFVSVLGFMNLRLTVVRSAPPVSVQMPVVVTPLPEVPTKALPLPVGHIDTVASTATASVEPPAAQISIAEVITPAPSPPFPWLVMIWAIGVSIFVMRLAFCAFQLRRWHTLSTVVPPAIASTAEKLCKELHLRVRVAVRMSHIPVMPMAWGIFRPTVLLPPEAEEWSSSRLRAVLLHELSHVRRGDVLTGTIAMLAASIHWFNPVVWFVFRRMQSDRELACDNAVLAENMLASDYATHLLAIGAGHPTCKDPLMLASTMARADTVEERIVTVLDASISRRRLNALAGWTVSLVVLAIATVVGSVQLLAAAPQNEAPLGIDINGPMTFQTARYAAVATLSSDGTSGHLHLVDLKDNSIVWSVETTLPPHDRPLMGKDHVLLMTSNRTLHCHAIADGALLWSHQTDEEDEYFLDAIQSNAPHDVRAILATLSGTQIILDVKTGERSSIGSFFGGAQSGQPIGASDQEVPPQFRDAYLEQRPTEYINDPQHLLAKEVRTRAVESLRNSSLIRSKDTQVLILDQYQEFPSGSLGQPGEVNMWTDDGTGRVIAYFSGDLDRTRRRVHSDQLSVADTRPPSFDLMIFLEMLDGPMDPQSKFTDTINPNAVEGDPFFSDTDDWDVIAVGGRHVIPVAQFTEETTEARSGYVAAGTFSELTDDFWNFGTSTELDLTVSQSSASINGHGTLSAVLVGNLGGQVEEQPRQSVPVYATSYDRIAEILVKEGDTVFEGTLLFKLMGGAATVRIRNASIELEEAVAKLDAIEENSAGRERLQREVKRRRSSLEKAAGQLVNLTVRSPAKGKVLKVHATVGEAPSTRSPVVTIQPD
ncbi:MAG: beta-lactamase regulating signal transducer with metallopeptidase domain [Verrucomicrobiales bacterium]|jgi:beta-lactamase regulating signal transducer with metallopeptidase domain